MRNIEMFRNISIPSDIWTIREQLCLASCVMRLGEDNWPNISRQMKVLSAEPGRSSEFYSQKRCAQRYSQLVEAIQSQKRRRSEGGPADPPAAQVVSRLTLQRIEELKKLVHQQNTQYKKFKRDLDAIERGELDHQLCNFLEQIEGEKLQAEASAQIHNGDQTPALSLTPTGLSNQIAQPEPRVEIKTEAMENVSQPEWIIPKPQMKDTPQTMLAQNSAVIERDIQLNDMPLVVTIDPDDKSDETSLAKANEDNFDDKLFDFIIKDEKGLKSSNKRSSKSPAVLSPISLPENQISLTLNAERLKIANSSEDSSKNLRSPNRRSSKSPAVSSPSSVLEFPAVSPVEIIKNEQPSEDLIKEKEREPIVLKIKRSPQKTLESTTSSVGIDGLTSTQPQQYEHITPSKINQPIVTSPVTLTATRRQTTTKDRNFEKDATVVQRTPSVLLDLPSGYNTVDEYKQWKKSILMLWRQAASHRHATPFMHPVTDEIAPGYSSIVHRPMDLSTIKKFVENGTIYNTEQFHCATMLMFANAVMYNNCDHDIHLMAKEMARDVKIQILEFLNIKTVTPMPDAVKSLRSREKLESTSDQDEPLSAVKKRKNSSEMEEPVSKRLRF